MKKKIKLILIIIFIFLGNSCQQKLRLACEISEFSQLGINHFNPLVEAMEKYKGDLGHYPEGDISILIPKYINRIPIVPLIKEEVDEKRFNVLVTNDIESGGLFISEDYNYFSIRFYVKDDRICLLGGRNNICEYTSETKQWKCFQ